MAGSFKERKLVLAFSSEWNKQSAIRTPLSTDAIDASFPLSTRQVPGRRITRIETKDCQGRYLVARKIGSRLASISTPFDVTSQILGGIMAMALGTAANPTGSTANEAQTVTIDANGGTFTLSFTFEGLTGTTPPLAWNAPAATVRAALENLRSIKPNNVTVTLVSLVYTVTFVGELASANVPALVANSGSLTGGTTHTATVATTTPGSQGQHNLTIGTAEQPPATSFIVGFEDDDTDPDLYKDMVVNSLSVRAAVREKVAATVEWFGSGLVDEATGFELPACVTQDPLYGKDCRVSINSVYYAEDLREFQFDYSNNLFTGDDPFPFDDIDLFRLERNDPTFSYKFGIYGSKGDAIYTLADGEGSIVPVRLDVGPAGDRVSIIAPHAQVTLADTPIVFAGEASRSAIQIEVQPFLNPSDATTPIFVIAYNDQAVAYLIAA